MLSNIQIEEIAGDLKLPIVGVFSKDRLPEKRYEGSYYVNLQDADDGDGTHWVFFRIFSPDEAVYFDSFGLPCPEDVKRFLEPFSPIPYNNRQIQDVKSSYCGWYCIACDYYFQYDVKKGDDIVDKFDDFLNMYSAKTPVNDKILKEYLKRDE